MRKIEEILTNIFIESNYEKITLTNLELITLNIFHKFNQEEYGVFVVDYREEIPEDYLSKIVPKIREDIDNEIKKLNIEGVIGKFDTKINKNMYLITCLNQVPTSKNQRNILEIEEDPYYFKKTVIRYTEGELSIFDCKEDSIKYSELIIQTISDEIRFSEYKESVLDKSDYETCLKFVLALPILTIEMKEIEFPDLDDNIEGELKEKDLSNINNLILELYNSVDEISVDELEMYLEENLFLLKENDSDD